MPFHTVPTELYEMASPFISINLFSRLRTSQDLSDTQRCSTFYTINLTQAVDGYGIQTRDTSQCITLTDFMIADS